MAAAGIGNPAGYVPILDGENAKIISGRAFNETISGGVFVFASGTTGVVSSGLNSFTTTDLYFARDASGLQFNGICMQTTGSNESISVATDVTCLVACSSGLEAGFPVQCDGSNAVEPLIITEGDMIGRALTAGASGGYCVVHFRA